MGLELYIKKSTITNSTSKMAKHPQPVLLVLRVTNMPDCKRITLTNALPAKSAKIAPMAMNSRSLWSARFLVLACL
jgi:hypothetical protein